MRRKPKRWRPAVTPRLPAFMAACGEMRVARNAGVRPKRMQVNVAAAAVNASTGQSGLRSTKRERPSVLKNATRKRLNHCANTNPSDAPKLAINKLSASNWRIILQREAPTASRTAISRSRALARANIRFARFAQAMSSTSAAIPSSSQSGVEYSSRSRETPLPACNILNLKSR